MSSNWNMAGGGASSSSGGASSSSGGATKPRRVQFSEDTKPRRVQFSEDTKPHDGLNRGSRLFADYITRDVFPSGAPDKTTVVLFFAGNLDVKTLEFLQERLINLMERLTTSKTERAPILAGGGRDCPEQVLPAHLPHLQQHVEYLDVMIGKVQTVIAQRATVASVVKSTQ